MFGIADFGVFFAAILMFLALPGPGTFALPNSTGKGGFSAGAAATAGLIIGDPLLLWLAVAGVAALLSAHPVWCKGLQYLGAVYLGWVGVVVAAFAAMALTIAVLTAVCCLALCGFAQAASQHVDAHRRPALALQRLAGLMVIGFGLRLVRD